MKLNKKQSPGQKEVKLLHMISHKVMGGGQLIHWLFRDSEPQLNLMMAPEEKTLTTWSGSGYQHQTRSQFHPGPKWWLSCISWTIMLKKKNKSDVFECSLLHLQARLLWISSPLLKVHSQRTELQSQQPSLLLCHFNQGFTLCMVLSPGKTRPDLPDLNLHCLTCLINWQLAEHGFKNRPCWWQDQQCLGMALASSAINLNYKNRHKRHDTFRKCTTCKSHNLSVSWNLIQVN